jgi:hypothetical protein
LRPVRRWRRILEDCSFVFGSTDRRTAFDRKGIDSGIRRREDFEALLVLAQASLEPRDDFGDRLVVTTRLLRRSTASATHARGGRRDSPNELLSVFLVLGLFFESLCELVDGPGSFFDSSRRADSRSFRSEESRFFGHVLDRLELVVTFPDRFESRVEQAKEGEDTVVRRKIRVLFLRNDAESG